jgi:hypothetical protein
LLEGRAAIGYDHGYDGQLFYLGLALDPAYIEGFVEGCLERIGEDNPEEEQLFRDLWEDETQSGRWYSKALRPTVGGQGGEACRSLRQSHGDQEASVSASVRRGKRDYPERDS